MLQVYRRVALRLHFAFAEERSLLILESRGHFRGYPMASRKVCVEAMAMREVQ